MQLLCYGLPWDGHLVRIADAVRGSAVGDEIRIVADKDTMVPEMRAFAHITGNRIIGVRRHAALIVDLERGPDRVYSLRYAEEDKSQQAWDIVIEVLPTNRLLPKC